jgi:hypothetical protein
MEEMGSRVQEYLHLCRSTWKKWAQESMNSIYVEVHGKNGLKIPGISAFYVEVYRRSGSRI